MRDTVWKVSLSKQELERFTTDHTATLALLHKPWQESPSQIYQNHATWVLHEMIGKKVPRRKQKSFSSMQYVFPLVNWKDEAYQRFM